MSDLLARGLSKSNKDKIDNLSNKTDYFVTPEAYGAKGDGITNDTEAIRQAIATGKEVRFLAKTYLVKIPTSNTYFALEANGTCPSFKGVQGKTTLKLELDYTVDENTNSKSGILVAWNTQIDGIIFDGGFSPTNDNVSDLASIVTVGANSKISNCAFKNSKGSNVGVTGSNIVITENKFNSFGDHAVYIHQEYGNARISKIKVFDNDMVEDDTYQNGVQGGQIRGVVKIRDNVEDVDIYNNKITGDQCILVSCKAIAATGISSKINIYDNKLYTNYSGVHLDTDISTDNGFRISKDDVYVSNNDIITTSNSNAIGVALEYSSGTINGNRVITAPSTLSSWAASTAKIVGEQVQVSGSIYEVTTAGTTGSTAPTGTGTSIADGTVIWKYISPVNTNIGISNFGTGDTGKSVVKGNEFIGVRIGIYQIGTSSVVDKNNFHDIIASGGVAIYSQYADRVINNSFYGCVEGLRIVGARSTKKAVYDNNSFYDCVKGILQKNNASGYSLTNNKFYDCTSDSLAIESASLFRAEKNFNNTVYSGVALPDVISSSSVVHSPFEISNRATLPGAIAEFKGKITRVDGGGTSDDKYYICIQTSTGTYAWKQITLA